MTLWHYPRGLTISLQTSDALYVSSTLICRNCFREINKSLGNPLSHGMHEEQENFPFIFLFTREMRYISARKPHERSGFSTQIYQISVDGLIFAFITRAKPLEWAQHLVLFPCCTSHFSLLTSLSLLLFLSLKPFCLCFNYNYFLIS